MQRRCNLRYGLRFAAFAAVAVFFASANAEQVFVKAVAPLDEPRGLCLDVPGHRSRVNVDAPLVVHTCNLHFQNIKQLYNGYCHLIY